MHSAIINNINSIVPTIDPPIAAPVAPVVPVEALFDVSAPNMVEYATFYEIIIHS